LGETYFILLAIAIDIDIVLVCRSVCVGAMTR